MSNKDLSHAEQALLKKGPSFIPTPTDINWHNLRRDFDSFVNKLRYRVSKPAETSSINVNHTTNVSNLLVRQLGNPPIEAKSSNVNFRKKKTNISRLEPFIDLFEKDLFKPFNYSKIKGNITTGERKALKSIQNDYLRPYHLQDKGSRFVVLDNQDYVEKIEYQLGRSWLEELDHDPSNLFLEKVNLWIQKCTENKVLDKSWSKFIEPSFVAPGLMYGLVKTHKADNPVRVITSGCGTAVENLSIFVEKCLFPEVLKIESRVQDTSEMLNFIDFLNDSNILTENCMLVSFDITNIFPNIDNESGLQAVKNTLEAREEQFPPTLCKIEALELCLKCNNSIFNKKHFLQNDSTAQRPHMSCSYGDIAIEQFDKKTLEYNPAVIGWKRFRDDMFLVWPHSAEDLN